MGGRGGGVAGGRGGRQAPSAPATPESHHAAVYEVVFGPRVALRAAPDVSAAVAGLREKGGLVEAVALSVDRNWVRLRGRYPTWCMLRHPEHGPLLEALEPATLRVVFEPFVVVRAAPDATAAALSKKNAGDDVQAVGIRDGWVRLASGQTPPRDDADAWMMVHHPQHGELLARLSGVVPELPSDDTCDAKVTDEERAAAKRAEERQLEGMRREVMRLKGQIHAKESRHKDTGLDKAQHEKLLRGIMAGSGTVSSNGFALGGEGL